MDRKIFDFHCHVYPEIIAKRASDAISKFYGLEHSGEVPARKGTPEDLLAAQKEAGIWKSLICSAATAPCQVRSINEFLGRTARDSHGQCLAFGTLHPDSEDVAGDLEHLLNLGLLGVKLHPDMQGFALNAEKTAELFRIAQGRVPFLLHTGDRRYGFSNPEQLRPVLEAFPETVFIGAHMAGYTLWQEATRTLAGKYHNLYVDISSTMFAVSSEDCVDMIRAYGANRVLFGTDYPMWSPKDEVARFDALPLTPEERERIAWKNAAALLGGL